MGNIFSKIGWFVKEHWKTYLAMFILLISIAVISLSPAYVLGRAIDTIISGGLSQTTLFWLVFFLALLPISRYSLSFLYNHLSNKTAQMLSYQMRKKYLSHLFDMDSQFYEKYQKGDLISRVTSDLDAITQAASSMLEGIIFNVGVILFAISIMSFTISWKLTLISVIIMPIGLTVLNVIRNKKT